MSSAIGKILNEVCKTQSRGPEDFWLKLEDEDEEYFLKDVFEKWYQYADEDTRKKLEKHINNKSNARNLV